MIYSKLKTVKIVTFASFYRFIRKEMKQLFELAILNTFIFKLTGVV